MAARCKTAYDVLQDYLDGTVEHIYELEEERLKAEEALRDSLEQADMAARQELLNTLEQTQQQSNNIVESEEDEFFQ